MKNKLLSETRKMLFREGKLVAYMDGKKQPDKTKAKIRKTLKRLYKEGKLAKNIGASGEDNPMKKQENINKMVSKMDYKEIGRKAGLTKKRLYSEGKIKTCSETRKRLFAEGKLVSPFKGLKQDHRKGKHHSEESIEKIKEKRAMQVTPKKDTSIEVKIQNFLKQLEIDFFTHQYIKEINHSYQCDILIPSMNLVIECDGDYWHKYPIGREIDYIRTSELLEKGFKVLRLWEFEIRRLDIDGFKQKIMELR